MEAIQNDHLAQADLHIRSPHLRASVRDQAVRECADLTGLLGAARRLGEVSDGTRDLIVSKGEKLSCIFMAALLRDRGVDARYVDLADAVVGKLLSTRPELDQEFYAELTTALTARVHACGAQVPVVTGYFGRVEGGLLRRIGRGYTDLCAALLAVGLGAAELQVWKEVDGIFTANPAKVPTARLLPEISPEEAAELTFYGSEVIHPFTMEQVIRAAIPIRIRNVMNLRNPGTLIRPDPALATPPPSRSAADDPPPRVGVFAATSPLHRRLHSTSHISGTATATGISLPTRVPRPKRPTAVTVKPAILVLNVLSNKRSLSHGFYARIFDTLDRFRLSVDLISTSEVHVSMALHSEKALQSGSGGSGQEGERRVVDADVAGAVEELRKCGTVDVLGGMAILSLVGRQMRNMMGIAGKMFSVLGENNVNIEMISQGESLTPGLWYLWANGKADRDRLERDQYILRDRGARCGSGYQHHPY